MGTAIMIGLLWANLIVLCLRTFTVEKQTREVILQMLEIMHEHEKTLERFKYREIHTMN